LLDAGFVVDGSPCNWARMEEWDPAHALVPAASTLYAWNKTQWADIGDTTQPYYPSDSDVAHPAAGAALPLLLLPDNGQLADYVTSEEMINIFNANWGGGALDAPRQVSYGYHPPDFNTEYFSRIDGALDYVDTQLASDGNGPAVYARMSDTIKVWPAP